MNSYGRIYELLLEEAFLLEQRKPLSLRKKLGVGLLSTAALFGAGKAMQGTSTAKATPTPVTAPAKGIKFKTDYERGGRMRSPLPKNPHGRVPGWAHTDDTGKARHIPRNTRYGASLEFNRRKPDREKMSRAITGKDPIMPKRTSGEIGPPAEPSFKAKMTKAVVSGYKQIKSASRAAQDHTSMASNMRGIVDKAKGLQKYGDYLGKKMHQADLHLIAPEFIRPPSFIPKGSSHYNRSPVELLGKQRGPKKITALSRPFKTALGKTGYPNTTVEPSGQLVPTSELPKEKESILDPGSKAQKAYLKYKDAGKPKKKK